MVVLGGEGGDELTGGATEDALVDGAGNDVVVAGGGDDAVPNNGGADQLDAGPGEDLFISNAVCDGDSLEGGADRDNANWANFGSAVAIDLATQRAGLVGRRRQPSCPGGTLTVLSGIEDIEGTSLGDVMIGDAGPNQLLGRPGADTYRAGDGNDSILANSGTPGPTPTRSSTAAPGFDTAQIDRPENGPDATPVGCEAVEERDPNSFRPPDTPPDPTLKRRRSNRRRRRSRRRPAARSRSNPAADADRPPPGRRLAPRGKAGRTVVFSFAASEPGATLPLPARPQAVRPLPLAALLQRSASAATPSASSRSTRAGNRDRSRTLLPSACGGACRRATPLAAAGAEAALAAGGLGERLDLDRLGERDRRDHELGDAVARLDPEGLGRVGVEQQDAGLRRGSRSRSAPGLLTRAIPCSRARPERGRTRPAWPVGDLDRDPGPDAPALAGPEMGGLAGVEIEPRVALVRPASAASPHPSARETCRSTRPA